MATFSICRMQDLDLLQNYWFFLLLGLPGNISGELTHCFHLILRSAPPPGGIWLPEKPLESGNSSLPLLPTSVMTERLFSCPGGINQPLKAADLEDPGVHTVVVSLQPDSDLSRGGRLPPRLLCIGPGDLGTDVVLPVVLGS